jgi:hypothetical protein
VALDGHCHRHNHHFSQKGEKETVKGVQEMRLYRKSHWMYYLVATLFMLWGIDILISYSLRWLTVLYATFSFAFMALFAIIGWWQGKEDKKSGRN